MSDELPESGSFRHARDNHLWDTFDWRHSLFVLAVLMLGMFGDVLFFGDGLILSAKGLDLYNGELSGLDFLSRELGKGNLSPWIPHLFSGTFSLATALYPPLVLHLFLPLPLAVNWGIALHVLLAGFFMYLWTARRGLHPLAALTAAVIFMFSGPFYLHVFAGHVGNLYAMTWAPLILMTVDGMVERPTLRWALLGAFAVAMQILTGQFQYVYYMGLTAILYSLVRLSEVKHRRPAAVLGLFGIAAGGLLLSAFHLLHALTAAGEGVRATGVAVSFAAMFSFPPENFLTLVAPFFFGDIQDFPYWGRCYLWEMCLFTGVAGFCMAVFGALKGDRRRRYELFVMIAILAILALGSHTPLFKLLFDWLPGFDKFRGTSKFMFFASMFWIMLAGYGCDLAIRGAEREGKGEAKGDAKGEGRQEAGWGAELEAKGEAGCELGREETSGAPAAGCAAGREANPAAGSDIGREGAAGAGAMRTSSVFAPIPLVVAALLGGLAIWLYYVPFPGGEAAPGHPSLWNAMVSLIAGSRESYLSGELYKNPHFLHDARQFAAAGLFVAAGIAFIAGGLIYLRRSSPRAAYVLILLAVVEMFIFGRASRPTFSYEDLQISQFKGFLAAHPGDYRVLNLVNPNTAMSTGAQDIWGYGPAALGRYVQFMAWTQGADPDRATTYLKIRQYHPLFRMLRLRYTFIAGEKGIEVREFGDWFPKALLIPEWKVVGGGDAKREGAKRAPVRREGEAGDVAGGRGDEGSKAAGGRGDERSKVAGGRIDAERETAGAGGRGAGGEFTGGRGTESRDEIFAAMAAPGFDPRRMVILDRPPANANFSGSASKTAGAAVDGAGSYPATASTPMIANAPGGVASSAATSSSATANTAVLDADTVSGRECAILEQGSDHFTVRARVAAPAMMLITDNYSAGWRVRPLRSGTQRDYEIIPANYTLMAVSLAPGEHLLRIEYRPRALVIGAWISSITLAIFVVLAAMARRKSAGSAAKATHYSEGGK